MQYMHHATPRVPASPALRWHVHVGHGTPLLLAHGAQRSIGRTCRPETGAAGIEAAATFPRQALHARILGFIHPVTEEEMTFEAPLPYDMVSLLDALRTKK